MIAQALQSNGAKVYISGRRMEVLEETAKRYSTGPGSIIALPGDVSSKEGAIQLAKDVGSKESKGIQLLVNNAGIARDDATKYCKFIVSRCSMGCLADQLASAGQPDMKDATAISEHFLKSEEQAWSETFQTNVAGLYYTSMAFLPLLSKGGEAVPGYTSQVVNVTSISGVMKGPSAGQPIYAASKGAATQTSRVLASLFTDVKVRVNTIAPGVFPSEMTAGSSGEDNKSNLDMDMSNPAGRAGHDTDMGATILFLAGRGGLFYNGQILYPDGGKRTQSP